MEEAYEGALDGEDKESGPSRTIKATVSFKVAQKRSHLL